MKNMSFLFAVLLTFVLFVLLLNALSSQIVPTTSFAETVPTTSFVQTDSVAVTITTSISEAPYSSQYYYMDIELTGISLLLGDSVQMNFPQEECYFGYQDLSLRCYDFTGPVPSIPPKEGDDLIEALFLISSTCTYSSSSSTASLPNGGIIRCLLYNEYSASTVVLETQMISIKIGATLHTGSDIFSSTFYAAKPLADFFQVSIGDKTMNISYPVTNFNNEEVSALLQVDQLIVDYLGSLPPNLKISLDMQAVFTTTTNDTCEAYFSSFLAYFLPSAYNYYDTSVFSPTSNVPLINQPAKDIGVFFDDDILYLFTGPNPDQNPGSISIPISMQVAFLATQSYHQGSQISCFHAFTTSYQELKSATLSIGMNNYSFNGIDQSLDYPITLLNQVPVEFTAGIQSLSYCVADDRMVLERTNGIVYGQEVYDLELLTGYTNRNYNDFFSQFDAIQGGFTQLLSTPAPSAIDSNSFADHKLTAITPNTLSFSQADLELRFARLMDQDGVTLTPVTPSILTYSLYQREYTVGYVPIPAFTPLASNSNIQIQVSNTKAIMSAQFALSAESSDVFAPTAEFSVDAIFTLRPHRLMGELFPQAHPIPVCSFVGAPATLRIMPHVYSPTGADIHTTAGIRIAGTMPWGLTLTMNCAQDVIPGLKTGNDDFLALPWVLRLFPHRVYVQEPVDTNVEATYDASWNKQEVLATGSLIYVSGPGIDNETQFNFIVSKVVEFVQNLASKEYPDTKPFNQFTSSDLYFTSYNDPNSNISFRFYNVSSNYGQQLAYPTDPTHLASSQTIGIFAMLPNIDLDPQFTWETSFSNTFYPELSLTLQLSISFNPSISNLIRYPNSLIPNQPTPIPYDPLYALTNFPWLTSLGGPCFSTLHCDLRNIRSLSDSFWSTSIALCFEGKCQPAFAVNTRKVAESKAHIFNPQKRRPDEFKMTGKVNSGGVNDIIIRGANEFGFGYVTPKFALQFTPVFAISLDTMINEQHVIIDNDNSEYQSIVGKKYTVQLLSFPSTSTGDIISPTLFRVHWTSSSTTIPTAETSSHLNIPAGTISAIGAAKMKFRVTYPDLLTTPTAANPNPLTYLDSAFFTSMSSCMAPPPVVSSYSDPSQWTNECKNGGQCQSAGCKCVNGYSGSLCATPPPVPTGCMAAPTTFCGVHGTCNQLTLRCDCSTGWLGSSCAAKEACVALGRDVCSNNGHFLTNPATEQCDDGKCECDNLWIGSKCSICSLSCKNGGRAHKLCTTCGCAAGFAGVQCTCSQQQASFTIAMNNELVSYVHSVRYAFATAQKIADISTIDVSTLDLPQDVISEYSIISDAVVQDLINSLGFSATTTSTAVLNMNTIINSLPPPSGGDNTDNDTFISTRFSFTLTYNCNQNEQINLQQVWNSKYISLLPTKTINTYFTPTRFNPLPGDVGITTPPGTLNGDYTIDTDDQPNEENSSSHFCFMTVIAFFVSIVCVMV